MSVALWDKGAISDPLRVSHSFNYIGSGVQLGLTQKIADFGFTMSVNMDLGVDKDVNVDVGKEEDEGMDVDVVVDEEMDVDMDLDMDVNMDVDVQV